VTLVILYPFSVWYVCKLDSWAHILRAFGFGLKTGVIVLALVLAEQVEGNKGLCREISSDEASNKTSLTRL
jgi:hypothetical protein